jgi:(1->4)-alpha-D-glucan 1-alpha-D-glucosylmutase
VTEEGSDPDLPVGAAAHRPDGAASTYRVQLHPGFGFEAAAAVADYLAGLGVTHLYCSPYLQAAPGSTHGYDVADPTRFNRELGGSAGHARLTGALKRAGLGQVLDIVPNHMAADPEANPWWWDVLENGPASRFASLFDIEWEFGDYAVLVPVLDDHIGRVLEAGKIRISRRDGVFIVSYEDHHLPVSPRTLDDLLGRAARRAGSAILAELAEAFAALPPARATDQDSVHTRHALKDALAARLDELCRDDAGAADALRREVEELNADFDRLEQLLHRQNYRLAYWRTASEELDYRRFFNIESLVGVRVEDPEAFALTHQLITELVSDGTVSGLRIDHVDGLADPSGYLDRLNRSTNGVYTVVEKILEPGEQLRPWPVAGTSGYDFLNRVNNLFVDPSDEVAMTTIYEDFTGESASWQEVVHDAKFQIMEGELSAEVGRLNALLSSICDRHRRHRDHTRRELRRTLEEFVAHFEVYRTYVGPELGASGEDRRRVAEAVEAGRACRPDLDGELFSFLGELALGKHPGAVEAEFVRRLQQLTAPVMAKGVEDTAFYRYNRLISLNEVGGDPGTFGRPVADFHADTADAAGRWPQAMLTLSTHDTKRSADVRARLNALSQVPERWALAVAAWSDHNDRHRQGGWPDRNAEYLLYQTVVGAWPITPERACEFMAKAAKEAKVHTSWTDPDEDYDQSLAAFTRAALGDGSFVAQVESFLASNALVERGRRNSLAQTALLLTCPGVPDIYQGTELWDLSLVDPDNRRPVDFGLRRSLLCAEGPPPDLAGDDSGATKLWLLSRLLQDRRANPGRYLDPTYEPLELPGAVAETVIGFRRSGLAVVAACQSDPGDATVALNLPAGDWRDVADGRRYSGRVDLGELLGCFGVSVLVDDAG